MMVESSPAFTVSEVPIPHVYSVVQKIPACLNFPPSSYLGLTTMPEQPSPNLAGTFSL